MQVKMIRNEDVKFSDPSCVEELKKEGWSVSDAVKEVPSQPKPKKDK